jgi:hypothetical protein
MKKASELNIFILGQSLLQPEWSSLMGDKYRHALPFSWKITDDFNKAQVIAWDGLMTPNASSVLEKVEALLKEEGRILLLQREGFTLFQDNPWIKYLDLDQVRYVELPSGGVLPEDLLEALEICHKKLHNV